MVDENFDVIREADRFLREIRLARGRAETTTKAYAEGVVLFLRWCMATGRDWRTAAREMGLFMLWLKWTPGRGGNAPVVVPGPGAKPVRAEIRVNKVLASARFPARFLSAPGPATAWPPRSAPLTSISRSGSTRSRSKSSYSIPM
ncbi:hypothetical protein ACWD95_27500 [Streptomyces sp. NPDC005069]